MRVVLDGRTAVEEAEAHAARSHHRGRHPAGRERPARLPRRSRPILHDLRSRCWSSACSMCVSGRWPRERTRSCSSRSSSRRSIDLVRSMLTRVARGAGTRGSVAMERISSGNEALDSDPRRRLPRNSTNLIMGMPGTGKTILAQSIMFHNATADGRRCTSAPSPSRWTGCSAMCRTSTSSILSKMGEAVIYHETQQVAAQRGPRRQPAMEHRRPDQGAPAGLRAADRQLQGAALFLRIAERSSASQLSVLSSTMLSSLAITSFWMGEYSSEEISLLPEFAVADGDHRARAAEATVSGTCGTCA